MKYDRSIDMSEVDSHTLILREVLPNTSVLEFGPATGFMTRFMKNMLGCKITCIEIDGQAAEKAAVYCDKMIVADIELMQWVQEISEEKFDYIIFADVLEHLKNPQQVLVAAVKLLKDNGSVLTSVPNIGHNAIIMELLKGHFNYQSVGLLDETHIHFFTKHTLLELLNKADLCPVKWLGTILSPELTEFQQQYTSFPQYIQNYLQDRDDAHVYQYVTVSKKRESLNSSEICVDFNIANNNEHSKFVQVFWEDEDEFKEEFSEKIPVHYEKGFVQYEFKIPAFASRIRIDPTNSLAKVDIQHIKLYATNSSGKVLRILAEASADNDFLGLSPSNHVGLLPRYDFYRYITLGHDSQLLFTYVLEHQQYKELTLHLVMRLSQIDISMIMDYAKDKNDEMDQLLSVCASQTFHLNQVIAERENQIISLNQVIAKREKSIETIYSSRFWRLTKPIRSIIDPKLNK